MWKSKEQIERSKRYLKGDDKDKIAKDKAAKDDADKAAKNKADQEERVRRQREAEDHELKNKAEQARRQAEARNQSDKIDRDETVNEGRSFIRALTGGSDNDSSSSRRSEPEITIVGEPTRSSRSRSDDDIIIDADFRDSESTRSAGRSYVSGWLSGSSQLLLPPPSLSEA